MKKYQKYSNKFYSLVMHKILKIATDKKIIGMAEATHGQKLITEFRIKVFKLLVKQANYSVFVLEESSSCCALINDYVKNGIGNPQSIIKYFMPPWRSYAILGLIEWMRKYNTKFSANLEFVGVDVQYFCNKTGDNGIIDKIKNDNFENFDNEIDAINYREKSMFELFETLYDPSKKYFMYMHNAHLMKNKYENNPIKWFGNYLAEKYSTDYYVVGNSFVNGSYVGYNPDEKIFEIISIEKSVLSLAKNGNNEGIHCDSNITIVEGSFYGSKKDPMKYLYSYTNNDKFDCVMIILDEKPLKFIDNFNQKYSV